MTRVLVAAFLCLGLLGAQPPARSVTEPPEEDAEFKTEEYTLNPLQSQKEFEIGQFYRKKGAMKAAALRFDKAFKWDNGNSEALYMLGVVTAKSGDQKTARETFERYLKAFPDGKRAPEVRKRLGIKP